MLNVGCNKTAKSAASQYSKKIILVEEIGSCCGCPNCGTGGERQTSDPLDIRNFVHTVRYSFTYKEI